MSLELAPLKIRAPRIVLYGPPGSGKSTLGASFGPTLILGTEHTGLDPDEFPDARNIQMARDFPGFYDNIREVVRERAFGFKYVSLDTVTKLDDLVTRHTIDTCPYKKTTLAQAHGGYLAGYQHAASLHKLIKKELDRLTNIGVTIFYICHKENVVEKPTDSENYTECSILLNHKFSRDVYLLDNEVVAFCTKESFLLNANPEDRKSRKIKKTLDSHICLIGTNSGYVTTKREKNMPSQIPMKAEEFKKHIKFYQQQTIINKTATEENADVSIEQESGSEN